MGTCRTRRPMPILVLAAALSVPVVAALAGCKSYLADSTTRTVGEFADDATIQFMVKSRLIAARDVRGMWINVEVEKGVVTLIGKVRTPEERERALEISAGIPNVVKVVDELDELEAE